MQMNLSPGILDGGWDFLQHNSLIESYACAPVPSHFNHLKLETYDGSSDPNQHMMRFTSQMYVYNSSNSACCRMFQSLLTRKALVWYAHLLP